MKKLVSKWMSFCCSVGPVGYCNSVMDGIKFEFNNRISWYTKNDSGQRRVVSLGQWLSTFLGS